MSDVPIERVAAERTHALRQAVLRPHQSLAEMAYPGDDDATTFHLAALADGEVVGIASVYTEPLAGEPGEHQWRLRGMATAESHRGVGLGGRLLDRAVAEVVERGGRLLWCNARVSASGFYLRRGFAQRGDVFELPGIGAHVVMTRAVFENLRPHQR